MGHENETKPCIGDDGDGDEDARESHFSTFSRATTKRILSLGICREFSARDFVSGSTRSRLTSFPAFSLRALVQETRSNFCSTIAQAFKIATRGLNIVVSFHLKDFIFLGDLSEGLILFALITLILRRRIWDFLTSVGLASRGGYYTELCLIRGELCYIGLFGSSEELKVSITFVCLKWYTIGKI